MELLLELISQLGQIAGNDRVRTHADRRAVGYVPHSPAACHVTEDVVPAEAHAQPRELGQFRVSRRQRRPENTTAIVI